MKEFKEKWLGFYAIPVYAILSIVAGCMYRGLVFNHDLLSIETFYIGAIFALPLVAGILSFVLAGLSVAADFLLKEQKNPWLKVGKRLLIQIVPWLVTGMSLITLGIFAPNALNMIMQVSQGLTPAEAIETAGIVPTAIVLVLTLVLAMIGIFLPSFKKDKTTAGATVQESSAKPEQERQAEEPAAQQISEEEVK